jgi:hypothetical protein
MRIIQNSGNTSNSCTIQTTKSTNCYLSYKYYVFGHYPSSCLYLKTPSCLFFKIQRFGDWILSPSSGPIGTSSIDWAQLSRFCLKTETEDSPSQGSHKQTSLSWVGLEPTIPVFERTKTIHAIYGAAIVMGTPSLVGGKNSQRCCDTHVTEPGHALMTIFCTVSNPRYCNISDCIWWPYFVGLLHHSRSWQQHLPA